MNKQKLKKIIYKRWCKWQYGPISEYRSGKVKVLSIGHANIGRATSSIRHGTYARQILPSSTELIEGGFKNLPTTGVVNEVTVQPSAGPMRVDFFEKINAVTYEWMTRTGGLLSQPFILEIPKQNNAAKDK